MMMEADKIRTTKKYIKQVRRSYERYRTDYEAAAGGLPKRMKLTRRPPTRDGADWARTLRWFECIRRVYLTLNNAKGKGRIHAQHDRMTARVLQMYVFKHIDGEGLCVLLGSGRNVSARYVNECLNEAVMAVKAEAEREGLFREEEEAACGRLSDAEDDIG